MAAAEYMTRAEFYRELGKMRADTIGVLEAYRQETTQMMLAFDERMDERQRQSDERFAALDRDIEQMEARVARVARAARKRGDSRS